MQRLCSIMVFATMLSVADADEATWLRHTIDASSRGADGVRLADVDDDGRLDIVTGWEEGGVIRICRHPGVDKVKQPWPAVTVGNVKSPEDAVFVDLNGDGTLDVVSCCEGKSRAVFVHLAPSDRRRFWEDTVWKTRSLTGPAHAQAWMYCLPLETTDGKTTLIVGSKGNGGSISRLDVDPQVIADADAPCRLLCEAGWIMSLVSVDMDGDDDADVLFSDRKGPTRGIAWLEQPADPEEQRWPRHVIGGTNEEVMFLDVGDLTGGGVDEIAVATKSAGVLVCQRDVSAGTWHEQMIAMSPDCGSGKGVAIADVDRDGRADLVVSCEHSEGKHGVFWLSSTSGDLTAPWTFHPISGRAEGIKFDRIEMLDLDADGDQDVLTCEERDNLGVVWYENPSH